MHPRMILTIFRKDFKDGIKNARILMTVLVPIGMGVFYAFLFDEDEITRANVTLAFTAAESTQFVERLRDATADNVNLTIEEYDQEAAVRERVANEDADLGLVIPAGFDAALAAGESPEIGVVVPPSPDPAARQVLATLQATLGELAGRPPPAAISIEQVELAEQSDEAVIQELGPRKYFVLVSAIFAVGMISMFAIPVVLTEETEKRTLDALVLVASYADVVAAKALLGLSYIAVAVPLLLMFTAVAPASPVYFVAAILLLSASLLGAGLLIGGLFRSMNQLNTWGGLLVLPAVIPAFAVGLPVPDAVDMALNALPGSQAMKLLTNAAEGETYFEDAWLAVLVLVAWSVAAFGLLLLRLRRLEA